MIRWKTVRVVPWLALLLGSCDKHGPRVGKLPVAGRVLDDQGGPVEGADIWSAWGFQGVDIAPDIAPDSACTALKSDATGAFSGKINFYLPRHAILAFDKHRSRGGMVTRSGDDPSPILMKLSRLTEVRCHFNFPKLIPEDGFYATLSAMPGDIYVGEVHGMDGDCSVRLPTGRYRLSVDGLDIKTCTRDFMIAEGSSILDLGSVVVQPTEFARRYGKEPLPWKLTDARGVARDLQIADLKGKWVLLEFWGYW